MLCRLVAFAVPLSRYQTFIPEKRRLHALTSAIILHMLISSLILSRCPSSEPLHQIDPGAYEVGLGFIFLLPPVMVTLTKRRVYWIRFFARPLGVFFFSCGSTCIFHRQYQVLCCSFAISAAGSDAGEVDESWWRTFGVWERTLPARAREPWTLPMIAVQGIFDVVLVWRGGIRIWGGDVDG
jgi:hypothetical protein